MSGGFLDIFGGQHEDVSSAEADDSVDLMYRPSEAVFSTVAFDLVERGWAVFPQEQTGNRRPGTVNKEMIKWLGDHELDKKLPTPEALKLWSLHCPTLNVACAMGQGSGGTFALDIDITDEDLAGQVSNLALEMLGSTDLQRVGSFPKIALMYRSDPEDPITNDQRYFSETLDNGEVIASEHAIEILADKKPITFFGKHHKTGRYFHWLGQSPVEIGPEALPVVSAEKLALFFEAVDENIRRFHRNANSYFQPEELTWDKDSNVVVPKLKTVAGGTPWVEDKGGKIIDGREAYLTRLVFSFVRSNKGLNKDSLVKSIVDQFQNTAEMSGKWTIGRVTSETRSKVEHLLRNIESGNIQMPFRQAPGPDGQIDDMAGGKFKMPYGKKELKERGLGFLPDSFSRKPLNGQIVETNDPIILTPEERQRQIDSIGDGLEAALDMYFEDVFMANCGTVPGENRVHVVKAPTGAGKTSRTIRYIGLKKDEHAARANAPRLDGRRDADGNILTRATGLDLVYTDSFGSLKAGRKPIVFLLPTYSNIEEVRVRAEVLNLDASLSDEELKQAALDKGLVPENELNSRLEDMKRDAMNAGLDVLVYKGKIAAGCQMAEKVQAAMEAGIGTSGFCKASIRRENGESDPVKCPHYDGCPAITQKEKIQESDLIFTPHPFMQLSIPEELEHARAVIADERIHHLFLHTTEFPVQHLDLPRKSVRLSKSDFEKGKTPEDFALARKKAVEIVQDAFNKDECPAKMLFEFRERAKDEKGQPKVDRLGDPVFTAGADLVEDCIKICSNGMKKDATLNPEMEIEEVLQMCAQPTGLHIREEHQFWTIIQERIFQLNNEVLVNEAIKNLEKKTKPEQAKERLRQLEYYEEQKRTGNLPRGKKDLRIQKLTEHVTQGHVNTSIRISWRTSPNWGNIPLLLLDASAAPEIINKIWNGAEVITHDISGPLHMKVVGVVNRTFSNASVVGDPNSPEAHKVITAQGLNKLRTAISSLSSWFGDSRVVAGTSILLRRTINTDWAGPENVDWCHYGAMRGLDFAKFHAAAFSVGRMELPIRTIDGLVAALTYDDTDPELPFDKNGDGLRDGKVGQPLLMPSKMQRLRMRSGEVVEIPTPMHPGKWGRLIQRQYREEELLQFCGRLRPVYRQGEMPIWFALSSVIPEDLIIDDLIHIDDLVTKKDVFWDAARRTKGILHPAVLVNTCPELFKDEEHAATMMEGQGMSFHFGTKKGEKSNGYAPYKIISDKVDTFAFVRTGKKDHVKELAAALKRNGVTFDGIEPVEKGERPISLARSRTPDNVDTDLGTMEERERAETQNADEANIALLCRNAERSGMDKYLPSHPIRFKAGESDYLSNVDVSFSDIEALETLKRVWEKMAYEKAMQSKNPLMQDEGDNYENMGNHVGDWDAGSYRQAS